MSTSRILGLVLGVLFSSAAMAQSLQLGQPSYGGNGCPAGSASAVLSPDSQELSVLFDSYFAEAGGTTGKRIDRKSCNLAIPVRVPQGYSVAILKVDYRGYVAVPAGGLDRLEIEYFWAGARGPKVVREARGPINDGYTVTDELLATTLVWSACGAEVNLRINSSMMAQSNNRMEQTIGTVDSVDVSSGVIYHLSWRRCN
jgi:hypothetical protein